MSNPIASVRALLIYVVCLPLAVFLGYLLAGPMDFASLGVFAAVVFLLVLPLLFRSYHVWLIISWNLAVTLYGFPGMPPAWFLMAFLGFFVALGHHVLNRERKYLRAPAVTWSLIFIGLVVLATMKLTSGFGLKMFGGATYGGKRYMYIFLAIVGYFAFISQPVPPEKRRLYAVLFFLSGATQAIGELVSFVPTSFYWIFNFFPPSWSGYLSLSSEGIPRLGGLATGSAAVVFAVLVHYKIEDILSWRKLWRLVAFTICMVLVTLGGFRSLLGLVGLTLVLLVYLEGLLWSRLTVGGLAVCIVAGVLCVPFSDRLPLSIQRTLSFLPLNLSPVVQASAEASSTWRFEMWQRVLPQVPKYLILGKGLSISGEALEEVGTFGNTLNPTESFEVSGDYHSGPLSLIITFGIFGAIGFLWFICASVSALRANYLYGDSECRVLNRFLLAYFIAKTFSFFVIFGSFYSDLYQFVGVIGLSIAINGGVAKKPVPALRPITPESRSRFPLFRKPAGAGG